ncbi:MAG: HPr-rel-A system PqqD family peptide chaperone [Blastomonas sp.]
MQDDEASRFAAVQADAILREPLDGFEAVYHRSSGLTHLLAEPAPQLLDLLTDTPLTVAEIAGQLEGAYDLVPDGEADIPIAEIVAHRLEELAALGLVLKVAGKGPGR